MCSLASSIRFKAVRNSVGLNRLHPAIRLQPVESADYSFYRCQLDACVYSRAPSCFPVRRTDADVGQGTSFHTTTHGLLAVVTDLEDLNSGGLQRTNECCNRSVARPCHLQLPVVV